MGSPERLVCVHCGADVKHKKLYKQYSAQIIEALRCDKCTKLLDNYIECDDTIVFLDVILLRISAFRHLLYNQEGFRRRWAWRLLVLSLLSEAYHHWSLEHSAEQPITAAIEISFYQKVFFVFICQALHMLTSLALLAAFSTPRDTRSVKSYIGLAEGLLLSNFAALFIPAVHIWMRHTAVIYFLIIKGYRGLSHFQALRALIDCQDGLLVPASITALSSMAEVCGIYGLLVTGIPWDHFFIGV